MTDVDDAIERVEAHSRSVWIEGNARDGFKAVAEALGALARAMPPAPPATATTPTSARAAAVDILSRVAQHACRQGESGARVWPALAELPFLESWRCVGETYADQLLAVVAVALTPPAPPPRGYSICGDHFRARADTTATECPWCFIDEAAARNASLVLELKNFQAIKPDAVELQREHVSLQCQVRDLRKAHDLVSEAAALKDRRIEELETQLRRAREDAQAGELLRRDVNDAALTVDAVRAADEQRLSELSTARGLENLHEGE